MKWKMNFNMNLLIPIVASFIVAGLFIAFGSQIIGDVQDDMTAASAEYNATQDTLDGVGNMSEKFPTLGTVIIAGVIITALLTFLAFRGR